MTKKKIKTPNWLSYTETQGGRALAALDSSILKFLYRWKVATSKIIHLALAREISVSSFNKRLKKLQDNELIEAKWDLVNCMWFWQLTDRGFFVIRESLGEIKDHGFRAASPIHDFFILAFQLGPWLFAKDFLPTFVTDQEFLKYDPEILSQHLPKTLKRRPDGVTLVPRGERIVPIAVEIELNAKSVSRYETVVSEYKGTQEVERVLWLVRDKFIVEQFKKAKVNQKDNSQNYHVFLATDEFIKAGWQARLTNENFAFVDTLERIMRGPTGLPHGDNVGTPSTPNQISLLFDGRKFLGR